MRQWAGVGLFLIFLLILGLSGCGGKGSSSAIITVKPATVTLAPDSVSLEPGQVFQLAATVKDSKGNRLANPAPTFASSNPDITVSTGGLVCAGIWDSLTTPVVCKTTGSNNVPLPVPATSNLTATAGGITSNTVMVFVHLHVDNITLSPASVDCKSQNDTQTFTATAFNNGTDITSTVGTFSWASTNINVVTLGTAGPSTNPALNANQVSMKAVNPGSANVVGSVSGTDSLAASFVTCPPATIKVHVQNATDTSFSIAVNSTKQLAADVVDTKGVTLTGVTLTWNTSQPAIASVSNSGLVTGVAPGVSLITASCTPSSCNPGVNQSIYSNAVTATVTGTAGSTTVYATTTTAPASGGHTNLIPISTSNNTAGTAIALPTDAAINSLVINPAGTRAYLGSNQGLIVVDITTNTVSSTVTNVFGKALVVSPNGQFILTSDTGAGKVYVFDSVNNTVTTLSIANATHASFTPDSFKAYIVAGSTLFQYSPSLTLRTIPMTTSANDVAVNGSGQFADVAGGEADAVAARSTCRNDSAWAPEDVVATTATPDLISAASTGDLLAVKGGTSTLDKVTPTIGAPAAGSCPPTLSDALATANWNGGCCSIASFVPQHIIVTPDGSKAFITSDQTVLLGYNVAANTTFSVAIGGATTTTGGATIDSSKVYVGGSDSAVHVIDVAGGTQSATVSLSFVPDLVAVKP